MPSAVQMIQGDSEHHWSDDSQCTSSSSSSSSPSSSLTCPAHCGTSECEVSSLKPPLPSICHRHLKWQAQAPEPPPPPTPQPPPTSPAKASSCTPAPKSRSRRRNKLLVQPVAASTASICVLKATCYLLHYASASLFLILALVTGLYSLVTVCRSISQLHILFSDLSPLVISSR